MKFIIDSQVLEKFPEAKVGLIVAKDINNADNQDVIENLRKAEKEVRERLELQTLADHPKIQDWRNAYSAFGSKPRTFKNSVEALLRRVLKGDELPHINTAVDIYNIISITHLLPVGGDNIDNMEGDLLLTIAKGGEPFTVLGNRQQEEAEQGEVIYRDDKEVLCRRWNWRGSDKTKLTQETKNVLFVLEALGSTMNEELQAALDELKELIEQYCGGEHKIFILDKENTSVEI